MNTENEMPTSERHAIKGKYYTTKELAALLNFSERWVIQWRHKIVGGKRIGRQWRFDKGIIDTRLAKGQDVRIK